MPTVCFDILSECRKNQIACNIPSSDNDYIFQNVREKMYGVWSPNNLTKELTAFIKNII